MRGEQIARQWHIMHYLCNSTRGRHIDDIAKEVGCSPRNVRRDLLALQEAGFALYNEKQGASTFWKTTDSFSNQPPIPLTITEIVSMLLAHTQLRSAPDDFAYSTFGQVLDKILKSRPPEFRDQMKMLQERFYGASSVPTPARRTATVIFETLSSAIAKSHKVSVTYDNAAGERTVGRLLAPLHIWVVNGSQYLVAYCYQREALRTFHLKRFQQVTIEPEKFEVTWEFDMNRHAEQAFGVFHAEPEPISIWMDSTLHSYIEAHPLHNSQRVTEKNGNLLVQLEVGINESLISRLMGFGSMARVLRPDNLAIVIMERHRLSHEHYHSPLPDTGSSLPLDFS